MKVGDYVRTQNRIFKITKLNDEYIGIDGTEYKLHYGKMTKDYYFLLDNYDDFETQTIYKSSPNIIDLIEVEDYVNGKKVINISKEQGKNIELYLDTKDLFEQNIYENEDIKTILTKEQFEIMEYKL